MDETEKKAWSLYASLFSFHSCVSEHMLSWSVTVTEVLSEERKAEAKPAVLGQAVVDLLPLLQGTAGHVRNDVDSTFVYCDKTNCCISPSVGCFLWRSEQSILTPKELWTLFLSSVFR